MGVAEGERLSCANCTTNQSSVLSITVASVARATQDVPPPNLQQLATCNISSYCADARATWRLVRLALFLISFLVRSSFSAPRSQRELQHFPDNFLCCCCFLCAFNCCTIF